MEARATQDKNKRKEILKARKAHKKVAE